MRADARVAAPAGPLRLRRRFPVAVVVAGLASVALTGCGRMEAAPPGRSLTVLAAASLTEPFTELGHRFRAAHPGTDVTFSFDASSTLVRQLQAGAPADVLATADEATMQRAVAAGAVHPPAVFAQNRLAILVARGNPKGVRSLADLSRSDLVVALCAPDAPCGTWAARALERAAVAARPRSLEPNVKGVVAKVVLGEADAGLVYATDARAAAGATSAVDIPAEHNVSAGYLIAPVAGSRNPALAQEFTAYVRSEEARPVLAAAGFAL